jgi:AAA domain-containing protein
MAHLVLVEGEEGVGKGMFAAWVAVMVASGAWGPARAVFWLSSEEEPEEVQNRLLAVGYKPGVHELVQFIRVLEDEDESSDDTIRLPRDFRALRDLVLEERVGLVITDVLRDHVNPPERLGRIQVSNNDETWVRPAAGSWERLATQADATILGLHHRNKGAGTARQRSTGTIAWRQRARVVVVLAMAEDERAFAQDKINVGPEDKTVREFDLVEVPELETARFEPGPVVDWARNIDHWEKVKSEPVKLEIHPSAELTTWCEAAAANGYVKDTDGDMRLPTREMLQEQARLSRRKLDEAIVALIQSGHIVEKKVKNTTGYSKYFWKISDH